MEKAENSVEKSKLNFHKDHRDRLKNRFLSEGLDGFQSHNALELLLFYAIPRKDTNETAHELINRFGSLPEVFDAPYEKLLEVPGINKNSATLIKLVPSLLRRYLTEKNPNKINLSTKERICRYLVSKYVGVTCETVYFLLLDNKSCLIDCVKIHEGSVNSSRVEARRLVEEAVSKNASSVVLAHNHPNGITLPSQNDIDTTKIIEQAFSIMNINFLGHMIVAGNKVSDICDKEKRTFTYTMEQ